MSAQSQQAGALSPDSTPRLMSSNSTIIESIDERWADMPVETPVVGHEVKMCEQPAKAVINISGELDTVGSRLHDAGRCKPCAFFHTKGCQSESSCQFCHRCPAHEKQRRKRIHRQLCQSVLPILPGSLRACRPMAGHSRMLSSDTASTCSGWVSNTEGQLAHSRATSISSQATGIYENGDGGIGYALQAPMYPSSQPQLMSPQGPMQPMMTMMPSSPMAPCNESGSMDATAVIDPMSPSVSHGGVLNLMTSMQAHPAAPQLPYGAPPSPNHSSGQTAQAGLSLPIIASNQYEQVQSPANMQVPQDGSMSPCGNFQYVLVPVPATYGAEAGYGVMDQQQQFQQQQQQQQQHQQQWASYQDYQQHGGCMLSPSYSSDQNWGGPYEAALTTAGASQWW